MVPNFARSRELVDARIQAHWAAQVVSALGRALLPHRDDSSETNLGWDGERQALMGRAVQGVTAEDRKDTRAAVAAYRKALDWDPTSGKARFNLGAIYLETKNYRLAEEQYRALVRTDPADYEAQYWLAESILAQPLSPARKNEACELLKRSLSIGDAGKKAQFTKAIEYVKCR